MCEEADEDALEHDPGGKDDRVVRRCKRAQEPSEADGEEEQPGCVVWATRAGDQAAADEREAAGDGERNRRALFSRVVARQDEEDSPRRYQ